MRYVIILAFACATQLRGEVAQPNMSVSLSEKFLKSLIDTSMDETTQTDRFVDGAWVHAVSRSLINADLSLLENERAASFKMHFHGGVNTQANGSVDAARGVQVSTSIHLLSQIDAEQKFTMNSYGIANSEVSTAVYTKSGVDGIWIDTSGLFWRLKERRAWEIAPAEIYSQLPSIEQRTSQEVRDTLVHAVNSKVVQAAQDGWRQLKTDILDTLTAVGYDDSKVKFQSDRSALYFAAYSQLTAQDKIPERKSQNDLEAFLDQDFITKAISAKLAGKSLTEQQFLQMLAVSRQVETTTQDADSMLIFFPEQNPFSIELKANEFEMVIRTKKFQQDGDDYPPLNTKVRYQVMKKDDQLVLKRLGEMVIYPPRFEGNEAATDLTPTEIRIKRLLRLHFNRNLSEELPLDRISIGMKTAKQLKVTKFEITPGVLQLQSNVEEQ